MPSIIYDPPLTNNVAESYFNLLRREAFERRYRETRLQIAADVELLMSLRRMYSPYWHHSNDLALTEPANESEVNPHAI